MKPANPLKQWLPTCIFIALLGCLQGCVSTAVSDPALLTIDQGRLPAPDTALAIEGLGPCTDSPDRTLHLNSKQPVTVLVHGCFGSAGLFRALAQVYAFHGQQTACFNYDDRDGLMRSSGQLNQALQTLAPNLPGQQITLIGHSQGGLIARKALVAQRPDPILAGDTRFQLVTISAPFAGIAAASHCGSPLLRVLSLGLVVPICHIITGSKWRDITYNADFIVKPGQLINQVERYLKIATDERGTCRKFDENRVCVKDDYVFSLAEQQNTLIDEAAGVKMTLINAGHVEIVGDSRTAPVKLINLLQQNGMLKPTGQARSEAFNALLARLYLPAR